MNAALSLSFVLVLAFGCVSESSVAGQNGYTNITAGQLDEMLRTQEVFLVDVHIPEQQHINGTDLFMPYNEIDFNMLPSDKNARIALYCRSGSMSEEAARQLADAGYANVYNLVGGKNAWDKYSEPVAVQDGADAYAGLREQVIPEEGITLALPWGNFWPELVEKGVINVTSMERATGLTEAQKEILLNGSSEPIIVNSTNARFLVNAFWALGLANKNPILEDGPMMTGGIPVGNYASTAGWTLGNGYGQDYYGAYELINLTTEQQSLVENVSKNIYRPCCNNPVYYPDCNHGMAILGLAEYMAFMNMSEAEIYDAALVMNSYWFPANYIELAQYFRENGTEWNDVDPATVLSYNYSSGSGFAAARAKIMNMPSSGLGGASCGA